MSADLDRELRSALLSLVDGPAPTGVAAAAIRRATRRRRAVRAGIGGLALAVVAVLAVTMLPLLRSADETVPPVDSPTPGPYTPSHVALAFGNSLGDASYVLNPATGGYDRYPYDTVTPTADAKRLLIVDTDENLARRVGILDRETDTLRWMPDFTTNVSAQWSPDESMVLVDIHSEPSQRWLVDAATLTPRLLSMPDGLDTVGGMAGCFTPDGQGFQFVRTLPHGERTWKLVAIERYSLDIAGQPLGEDGGWSATVGFVPVLNVTWAICSHDNTQFLASIDRGDGTYDLAIISAADGSVQTVPVGLPGVVTYADRDMVLLRDDSIIDHTGRLVGVLPPSVKGRLFDHHTTIGRASAFPGLPPSLIF